MGGKYLKWDGHTATFLGEDKVLFLRDFPGPFPNVLHKPSACSPDSAWSNVPVGLLLTSQNLSIRLILVTLQNTQWQI